MQTIYVKFLVATFFYCLFGLCIDTPAQAQRVVAIHDFDYDGLTCNFYDDEDEAVKLFRDVFGHESYGGGKDIPLVR